VHRSRLLFERYPLIEQAYRLATELGTVFRVYKSKEHAFKRLALWYNAVEDCGLDSFKTVCPSPFRCIIWTSLTSSAIEAPMLPLSLSMPRLRHSDRHPEG
jgi:hypothetical protein